MPEEQELTPEERLLKVIQKGEEPTTVMTPEKDEQGVAEGAVTVSETTAPPVAVPGAGLSLFNRILSIAAVLFLMLAVYETYLNLPAAPVFYPEDEMLIERAVSDEGLFSLSDTVDMYAMRRVFGEPPPAVSREPVASDQARLVGWRAYARENMSLIGMSNVTQEQDGREITKREAILMDNKTKRMHFLTEGIAVVISDQSVNVAQVGDAFVKLRFGEEILRIE